MPNALYIGGMPKVCPSSGTIGTMSLPTPGSLHQLGHQDDPRQRRGLPLARGRALVEPLEALALRRRVHGTNSLLRNGCAPPSVAPPVAQVLHLRAVVGRAVEGNVAELVVGEGRVRSGRGTGAGRRPSAASLISSGAMFGSRLDLDRELLQLVRRVLARAPGRRERRSP